MWKIVGHERAVETLGRLLVTDRLPHALLLTGPGGVGKTRLALELAKALNCIGGEPPCQVCVQCRQMESLAHPDLALVQRAEGKDSITIQQVRELRESASLRPFQGRVKVYIIAGAEALTAQAADALLKTIEEPQPQVVIVLTAIEENAVPGTVVSRCRVVSLQPVPTATILSALRDAGEEPAAAERVARLAGGNVGWALSAAKGPKLVSEQEELIARLTRVLDLSLDARLQLAESLAAERKDRLSVRRTLEVLTLLARDLLLLSHGLPTSLVAGQERETLAAQAERCSVAQIHDYLQRLRLTMARIDQNVDPRLALEALMVNLP